MKYLKDLKEIKRIHWEVSHLYPRHMVPSHHLPQSAGVYLDSIEKAKRNAKNQQDINSYLVAELFFRDFIDPTGEFETSKTLNNLERKTRNWQSPNNRVWSK